jgi:hypothetical protein
MVTMDNFLAPGVVKVGNKLLESLNDSSDLPKEIAARFKQQDLSTAILYSGEDQNGHYILAWLAQRSIAMLPNCLKADARFQRPDHTKGTYHELTFTNSSVEIDLNFKIKFYEKLYASLYHQLRDHNDKQIIIKACLMENRWLREVGFGPYEEIAVIPEELSVIALSSVDCEAYYHFLKKDALEIMRDKLA